MGYYGLLQLALAAVCAALLVLAVAGTAALARRGRRH